MGLLVVVALTRPPGEPHGDNPVFLPGTDLIVSDVVSLAVSSFIGGDILVQAAYFDDDDLSLSLNINEYTIPLETGELQDVTSLLGSDSVGWRISVQSTVIPEPGTGLLVTTGLLGLALWRTRLRGAR